MTTQEIIDYYKSLLIMQYRSLPNALAQVGAWVGIFLQDQIVAKVGDAFNLETATGRQLDILGAYRGISRIIFGITQGSYWSLVPYDDADPDSYFGWALYDDADPTWLTLQYDDLNNVGYTLSDYQMRTLISLKAEFDSWDGTIANLDNILYSFFGNYVNVVDNENMTMVYEHNSADPDPNQIWLMTVTAGILPSNAGVSYTVLEV